MKLVADIGCNRGFVSRHIIADTVGELILCESSPTMLEAAAGTPGLKLTKRLIDNDKEWPDVRIYYFELFKKCNFLLFSLTKTHWI